MAKKQEVLDEQQLKRELNERKKTCKYLEKRLRIAEARPPQIDNVAVRELEEAKRRVAELERNLEVKRKQVEDYQERLERIKSHDLPPDVLELRLDGKRFATVSHDGAAHTERMAVCPWQLATLMRVLAHSLGFAGRDTCDTQRADITSILEEFLRDVTKLPLWDDALDHVLSDYCGQDDDS